MLIVFGATNARSKAAAFIRRLLRFVNVSSAYQKSLIAQIHTENYQTTTDPPSIIAALLFFFHKFHSLY